MTATKSSLVVLGGLERVGYVVESWEGFRVRDAGLYTFDVLSLSQIWYP